jgi:hypothetical protein
MSIKITILAHSPKYFDPLILNARERHHIAQMRMVES